MIDHLLADSSAAFKKRKEPPYCDYLYLESGRRLAFSLTDGDLAMLSLEEPRKFLPGWKRQTLIHFPTRSMTFPPDFPQSLLENIWQEAIKQIRTESALGNIRLIYAFGGFVEWWKEDYQTVLHWNWQAGRVAMRAARQFHLRAPQERYRR